MLESRNILLSGVPRSGTTLVCALLSELPDVVALHEPLTEALFDGLAKREAVITALDGFMAATRETLLARGRAPSRQRHGVVPENKYAEHASVRGLRELQDALGEIHVTKRLQSDFILCVKEPVAFTAFLEQLDGHFSCFAVIRNPLAVLASWNSVDTTLRSGHLPFAERHEPALASRLRRLPDVHERQMCLLDWFFEKYARSLAPGRVVKYEQIVATAGRCLEAIAPAARSLNAPLENRNANRLYDRPLMRRLGELLLQRGGAHWEFYSRAEVAELHQRLMMIEATA